ncbi:MAG: DeoR family transcriptional regulator [Odoribacter sp.]|nr:DeoR family transcriptional regulator [Odoribacter sp.]
MTLRLEAKYYSLKSKGGDFNERQKKILEYIKINQPVKVNDISKVLPEYPQNTIRKDVTYLWDEQVITPIGAGRGTKYVIETN